MTADARMLSGTTMDLFSPLRTVRTLRVNLKLGTRLRSFHSVVQNTRASSKHCARELFRRTYKTGNSETLEVAAEDQDIARDVSRIWF